MKQTLALLGAAATAAAVQPPNVMMFIVDDLRPEISQGYEQHHMKTPNIDQLAKEGTVFNRAFCQQAICGPTRNSFMSGRRPQRTQSWNFINSFRDVGPNWVAFPQYFKNNNYTTLGTGKTYHPGIPKNNDEPLSWSQDRPYVSIPNTLPCDKSEICPIEGHNLTDFSDGANLQAALDDLDYMVKKGGPFFLAYGAHKPHLPWVVPKEHWDQYAPTENISLPLHEAAPEGMPPIAFTYETDGQSKLYAFNVSHPVPYPAASTAFPANFTKTLRRGYYAAVSFTDSNIGLMMKALKDHGVYDNTIIALIGDHGWQLGEHNVWGKHTNFELGTRVPLIIKAPGKTPGFSNSLVESVDLYPTIAKLAGLPFPDDVDGVDLTPIMDDNSKVINDAVFSEYPRCPPNVTEPWGDKTSCVHTAKQNFTVMGYSVRTDEWRYTTWMWWDGVNLVGDFSRPPVGEELYSHAGDTEDDFNTFENVNVVNVPANQQVVKDMRSRVEKQWKKN
eukprot:TRINITY_DN1309_c0_g1_i8.p1 TRINITY_DN1309_c0_g1~~TRINITY_DN1309_c0_g1_i8.p1  ORF type:complete len:502 (+),score=123.63 TRINITY_DN1309_c0_g1_i8:60-1565(+)